MAISENKKPEAAGNDDVAKQTLAMLTRIEKNTAAMAETLKSLDWKAWVELRSNGLIDEKSQAIKLQK